MCGTLLCCSRNASRRIQSPNEFSPRSIARLRRGLGGKRRRNPSSGLAKAARSRLLRIFLIVRLVVTSQRTEG